MNAPPSACRQRGSMLIVALGILTLLSLLAVTFVTLMNLERSAATNYVDSVKAKMAAEAGIQRMVADVRRVAGKPLFDPGSGKLYPYVYHSLGSNVMDVTHPIEKLKKQEDTYFYGYVSRSYSTGRASDAEQGLGVDEYKVKMIDTSALFDLNFEPFDLTDGKPVKGQVLERMLTFLGAAIAERYGIDPVSRASFEGEGGVSSGAAAILAYRAALDGRRFRSKSQLLEIMPEDAFRVFRDFVTCHGAVDEKAVAAESAPKGQHHKVKRTPRAQLNVNLAPREVLVAAIAPIAGRRFAYNLRAQSQDMEAQNPASYFGQNAGTPNPAPAGFNLTEDKVFEPAEQGFVYFGEIGYDNAKLLADWLIQQRPILSYGYLHSIVKEALNSTSDPPPFNSILATIPVKLFKPQAGWTPGNNLDGIEQQPWFQDFKRQAVYSMLLANFSTIFVSNSTNPNGAGYLAIDKGSLLYPVDETAADPGGSTSARQTFDFCYDTSGVYEITSLGQIRGKSGEIVAQEKIFSAVRVMDRITLRSQYEFEKNDDQLKNERDDDIASWPEPKFNFAASNQRVDEPQMLADRPWGHIELAPMLRYMDGGIVPADELVPFTFGPLMKFAVFFEGDQVKTTGTDVTGINPASFLHADVYFDPGTGDATGHNAKYNRDPSNPAIPTYARARGDTPNVFLGRRTGGGQAYPASAAGGAGSPNDFTVGGGRGMLFRDGFYTSYREDPGLAGNVGGRARRGRTLWYRAGYGPTTAAASRLDDDKFQGAFGGNDDPADGLIPSNSASGVPDGAAAEAGNIGYRKGSIEFWYKPDYDWSYRDAASGGLKATPLFCGLVAATRVWYNPRDPTAKLAELQLTLPNPLPPLEATPTDGTQLYIFRNTEGFLRATRIYFRVVGSPVDDGPERKAQELPARIYDIWPTDNYGSTAANDPFFRKGNYVQGGTPTGAAELYHEAAEAYPFDAGAPPTTPPSGYPWPPLEFKPDDAIVYARVDAWVPYDNTFTASPLAGWKSNEWHHIAVTWDDGAGAGGAPDPTQNLKIYVDGVEKSRAYGLPSDPNAANKKNLFCRINEPPGIQENDSANPDPGPATQAEEKRYPRDTLYIAGFERKLAFMGAGVFKHRNVVQDEQGQADEDKIRLFACGTIDDVAIFDQTTQQITPGMGGLRRFRPVGSYKQVLDLSPRFPDGTAPLELARLSWTALLPMEHGRNRFFGTGAPGASVALALEGIDASLGGSPSFTYDNMRTKPSSVAVVAGTGSEPAIIAPGQVLKVKATLRAASFQQNLQLGYPDMLQADTPLLGEVTLSYFLPFEDTLLKERILD